MSQDLATCMLKVVGGSQMEATSFSERLVSVHNSTQRHIPEEYNRN
jgi:hypothetical protein